ncbi:MAG TPA: glycosyltransferase family 2 protein [Candidatus Omnitrophota bacterium]|nr:glycosyltransferase family 2 protein [Candidatus Omnitrophota bacterium]
MKVSIIIPTYQEMKWIEKCLLSLLKNNLNVGEAEILIVDGISTDGTRNIVSQYIAKYPGLIRMIDNSRSFQVFGLNEAIREAKGEIIIRCDAHSQYPDGYVETLFGWHEKNVADNIGGCWDTLPGAGTAKAKGIAIAMTSPAGVGFSYRTAHGTNPRYVDTVPFGSWKRSLFDEVGFFDERFIRAQDLEHNVRMKKMGKKIMLLPWLKIKYHARDSWRKIFEMFFQYGYWKNKINKKHKILTTWRQIVPPLFLLGAIFLLLGSISFLYLRELAVICFLSYFLILFAVSVSLVRKQAQPAELSFYVATSFVVIHLAYALGYCKGLWDYFILNRDDEPNHVKNLTR